MSDFDWSRFQTRIDIKAPIDQLYHAWATRLGMEYWFVRMSEYKKPDGSEREGNELVEPEDSYKWLWFGWPDEMVEYGKILDCNGKDYLRFSFGKAGDCTVKIYTEQGTAIVELVQENIPTDEKGMHDWHVGCKTGWTFYLANLKSLYEGGIDLRNKNQKLQQVLNS